jgi:hypothetical protein
MEWEAIVNKHSDTVANRRRNKRMKRELSRVLIPSVVAIAFLVATVCNLVQPVLGMPVMVISLMIGCYNFGRVKAV